ncbi:MAG: HAD family hydrolase [Chloroflexi bacterium]|nr:HAD family hydrolase [Chloroflexota bacterium]
MRPLKAITLDLWGTIVDPRDAPEKIERRRAMILGAIEEAGLVCSVEQLRAAYRSTRKLIEARMGKERIDLGPPGRWALLCEALGLEEGALPFERVAAAYEDLTLEFPPALLPGAREAIDRLRSRYALGLICNTGYTGGKVLRELLGRYELSDSFQLLVFSNEFGYLKPDPSIFHHTLSHLCAAPGEAAHIGDLEELDVDGALNAGMAAIRYLPDGPVETKAHLTIRHWSELPARLREL